MGVCYFTFYMFDYFAIFKNTLDFGNIIQQWDMVVKNPNVILG